MFQKKTDCLDFQEQLFKEKGKAMVAFASHPTLPKQALRALFLGFPLIFGVGCGNSGVKNSASTAVPSQSPAPSVQTADEFVYGEEFGGQIGGGQDLETGLPESLRSAQATAKNPFVTAGYWNQCTAYAAQHLLDRGLPLPSTRHAKYWIQDNRVLKYGAVAEVNSVLVLGGWAANPYGHVAIVTRISGRNITVRHRNWRGPGIDSNETFQIINGVARVILANGKPGATAMPVVGFLYARRG